MWVVIFLKKFCRVKYHKLRYWAKRREISTKALYICNLCRTLTRQRIHIFLSFKKHLKARIQEIDLNIESEFAFLLGVWQSFGGGTTLMNNITLTYVMYVGLDFIRHFGFQPRTTIKYVFLIMIIYNLNRFNSLLLL